MLYLNFSKNSHEQNIPLSRASKLGVREAHRVSPEQKLNEGATSYVTLMFMVLT